MGDSQRSPIFAAWIEKNYPKAKRIANIAGGNEHILDADHYTLPRHNANTLHFTAGEYDLIIGMHPDEATLSIIRLARESQCSFAIVPCCAHGEYDGQWAGHIIRQARGFGVRTGLLHMTGKNLIIYGDIAKENKND